MTRRLALIAVGVAIVVAAFVKPRVQAQAQDQILFLTNTTNPASLGAGDKAIKDRLECVPSVCADPVHGAYTVVLRVPPLQTGDLTGKKMILISSSAPALSPTDTASLRNSTTGLVSWSSGTFAGLYLTATSGTTSSHFTEVVIATPNLPTPAPPQDPAALAGGFPLTSDPAAAIVPIMTTGGAFTWGWPADSSPGHAFVIATAGVGTNQAAIFGYEINALLVDNVTHAPARRLGMFMTSSTAASFNTNGWKLFDSAMRWASFTNQAPKITFEDPVPVNPPRTVEVDFRDDLTLTPYVDSEASVTDDGIPFASPSSPAPLTYQWTKDPSNPKPVTFLPAATDRFAVADFQAPANVASTDQYVLYLTANDGLLSTAHPAPASSDTGALTVSVKYVHNEPPVVNAGPDQTVTLTPPTTTINVTLNGSHSDDGMPPGSIVEPQWTLEEGPPNVTFSNANAWNPQVTLPKKGFYRFKLIAREKIGAVYYGTAAPDLVDIKVQGPALLVVGSTTLTAGDTALRDRLIALGFAVTIKGSSVVGADADNKYVVIISGTVTDSNVTTKFRDKTIPVVVLKSTLLDDMKMTGTTSADFGTITNQTALTITDTSTVLSAGLLGTSPIPVVTAPKSFSWGKPSTSATKVASVVGDATKTPIFGYAPGATMVGLNAPARRVGFFAQDAAAAALTAEGGLLFDAAVGWAATTNTAPKVNPGADFGLSWPVGAPSVSTMLQGTYVDDGLPNPPAQVIPTWTIFGPQGAAVTGENTWTPTATFGAIGTWTLTLTATDGELDSACVKPGVTECQVRITVSQPNSPPSISITAPSSLQMTPPSPPGSAQPAVSTTLSAAVTDDGLPNPPAAVMVKWSATGPGTVTFGIPTSLTTSASFPVKGTYTVQLAACDGTAFDGAVCTGGLMAVTTATVTVRSTALLVVGSQLADSGDVILMNRLQAMSYVVTITDGFSITSGATAASGQAVVIISPSAIPADVNTKFRTTVVPVVTARHDLFDDMALTTAANFGLATSQSKTTFIAAASDAMTTGLSGTVTIGWPSSYGWGIPATAGQKVAALASDNTKYTIFRYLNSAAMAGGVTVNARRVAFFATTSTLIGPVPPAGYPPPNLNEKGLALFDAAVSWAANVTSPAVISAGPSLSLHRTGSSVTGSLQGSVSPSTMPVLWTMASGPQGSSVTFGNASLATTTATFTVDGTYTLQLTAMDGSSRSAQTTVTVSASDLKPFVNPGPNFLAAANPGEYDNSIPLPAAVPLNGVAYDDGQPNGTLHVLWQQAAGPGKVTFANAGSAVTTARFDARGRYALKLAACDGTAFDGVVCTGGQMDDETMTVDVTANAVLITAAATPTADEQTIQSRLQGLGFNTALVAAATSTSSSADRMSVVVISPTVTDSNVTTKFKLVAAPVVTTKATLFDDMGLTSAAGASATNQTKVTLVSLTHPLVAGLGGTTPIVTSSNATFAYGTNTTIGAAAVKLGNVFGQTVQWALFGYEKGVAMQGGITSAPERRVAFGFCAPSKLTADGWALFDAAVRWAPGVNGPPRVFAGSPQTITLPAAATLSGTVTDDGLPNPPGILTKGWSAVGGPAGVTFDNPSSPSTVAHFTVPGVYILQLMASDTALTNWDQVTIVVNSNPGPPNDPPTVNAGPDVEIPLNATATLNGLVSDDGAPSPPGTVTGTWSKIVGPGTVNFGNASAIQTTATFSATGTYVLRLTVSDSVLSSSDEMLVTVAPTRSALLVTGNSVTAADNAVKARLESMLLTVTRKSGTDATSGDATGKNLVFITSSATQGAVGTKFTNVAVPVIVAQPMLYHDMGFADVTLDVDYGSSAVEDAVFITNPTHPLAAGLTGVRTVTNQAAGSGWATGLIQQWQIGHLEQEPPKANLFAYEKGEIMLAAVTAPARRVGLFNSYADLFTADGWALFDAAVKWASARTAPAVFVKGGGAGSEVGVRRRLAALGYALTDKSDAAVTLADAESAAVVVVSRSADSAILGTKLRNSKTPVITFDPQNFAAMGMAGSVQGDDYGFTPTQTEINVIDDAHPLAGGLSGRQPVLTAQNGDFGWAMPASSATKVGVVTGFSYGGTVFGYEKGAAMVGVSAASRRVGLFMNENSVSNFTAEGFAILDAAIRWCGDADYDNDGLSGFEEFQFGTQPFDADTNDDGILDGPEVGSGKSPTNTDMDGDGVLNATELQNGTDPFNPDTDGDGFSDSPTSDCFPLDKTRWTCPSSAPGDTFPPVITLTEPTNWSLISSVP